MRSTNIQGCLVLVLLLSPISKVLAMPGNQQLNESFALEWLKHLDINEVGFCASSKFYEKMQSNPKTFYEKRSKGAQAKFKQMGEIGIYKALYGVNLMNTADSHTGKLSQQEQQCLTSIKNSMDERLENIIHLLKNVRSNYENSSGGFHQINGWLSSIKIFQNQQVNNNKMNERKLIEELITQAENFPVFNLWTAFLTIQLYQVKLTTSEQERLLKVSEIFFSKETSPCYDKNNEIYCINSLIAKDSLWVSQVMLGDFFLSAGIRDFKEFKRSGMENLFKSRGIYQYIDGHDKNQILAARLELLKDLNPKNIDIKALEDFQKSKIYQKAYQCASCHSYER